LNHKLGQLLRRLIIFPRKFDYSQETPLLNLTEIDLDYSSHDFAN